MVEKVSDKDDDCDKRRNVSGRNLEWDFDNWHKGLVFGSAISVGYALNPLNLLPRADK